MTRDAALETAYRLAAGSGIAYNVYHSRRTRSGWQIIDGYRVNKDSFYTVNPDRSATFRLGIGLIGPVHQSLHLLLELREHLLGVPVAHRAVLARVGVDLRSIHADCPHFLQHLALHRHFQHVNEKSLERPAVLPSERANCVVIRMCISR